MVFYRLVVFKYGFGGGQEGTRMAKSTPNSALFLMVFGTPNSGSLASLRGTSLVLSAFELSTELAKQLPATLTTVATETSPLSAAQIIAAAVSAAQSIAGAVSAAWRCRADPPRRRARRDVRERAASGPRLARCRTPGRRRSATRARALRATSRGPCRQGRAARRPRRRSAGHRRCAPRRARCRRGTQGRTYPGAPQLSTTTFERRPGQGDRACGAWRGRRARAVRRGAVNARTGAVHTAVRRATARGAASRARADLDVVRLVRGLLLDLDLDG